MTVYLACDGGGTRTTAGLYDAQGRLLGESKAGPCNPAEYGLAASLSALMAVSRALLRDHPAAPVALGAGISGAVDPTHREALGARLCDALDLERAVVAPDIHALLCANAGAAPAILVIAGTGSSVVAQDAAGAIVRIGGRGHVLGDAGSAYRIAENALRAAARARDGLAPPTVLTEALPAAAGLAAFEGLTTWTLEAPKRRMAALAEEVAACAEAGDKTAKVCIEVQARQLTRQVLAARGRMAVDGEVPVFTHGGLFNHCRIFAQAFQRLLAEHKALRVTEPAYRGHRAVYALTQLERIPDWATVCRRRGGSQNHAQAAARPLSPTEEQAGATATLDEMTAEQIVDEMNREDASVAAAVAQQAPLIAEAIEAAARAIRCGGRIIYVGAGTSGRLGVLDASECPPTFGVAPERVVGIIAGGATALRSSVEEAEDAPEDGAAAINKLGARESDLVVGITASGTTPYALGALDAAKRRGAATALVACNPRCTTSADIVILLDTGPEVLTGSTRLKAGSATKMVLNMISTGAMARAGYVYKGLMAGMKPVNAKLRRRATRVVALLAHLPEAQAATLLAETDYNIGVALLMALKGLDKAQAQGTLDACGGAIREALR